MTKKDVKIFYVGGFVILIILIVLYLFKLIDIAQAIQIILTFALVSVTAVYVRRTAEIAKATNKQADATKEQADSSVKMAKEMREQRLDSARPVIDIQREDTADAHISAGLAAESGDFAWGLSCKLHNIGIGPALDIHSYIQFQRERWPFDFGTIAAEERTKGEALSVSEEGGRLVLKVYYKDIYGRDFESSREVKIDKATSNLELGPLKSILVEEHKE